MSAPYSQQVPTIPRGVALLLALGLSACASFNPLPLDEMSFRDRLQTEEQAGLKVSVAVLSREEARQAFGVNLQKRGIQPVWLEVQNNTDKNFWFMTAGLDPNYFSAHEAAYMNHFRFAGETNQQIDAYFSELDLGRAIPTGTTRMGFAFVNETVGTKEVRVRLYSHRDVRTFEFFVSVPGIVSEWDQKDVAVIAEQVEIETDDVRELSEALLSLPCCTQRENGTGEGDPLNLVVIRGIPTLKAFITAGWDETIFQKDFRSLFGAAYLYGRPPDVQFQKARRRVESVNLVQLWITPIRYKGDIVMVGSVSRSIDPNVDEAVQYVTEDLATAGMVETFGRIGGVGEVAREKPRKNFANAPYWTDGNRTVLQIALAPVELTDIDFFPWDWERRVDRAGDE